MLQGDQKVELTLMYHKFHFSFSQNLIVLFFSLIIEDVLINIPIKFQVIFRKA